MNNIKNPFFSKPYFMTLFIVQNGWHQHGVMVHTLRVFYYVLKDRNYRMLAAALLHDIGKPLVAFQDEGDKLVGEYSFTDHEERSYEVIRNWPFISEYTKEMTRHHYLIRDIAKHKVKKPERHKAKKAIWDGLPKEVQTDLKTFLKYDDLGKGVGRKEREKQQ